MITLGDKLPTIDAPRLTLRALTSGDTEDVFQIFSNTEVMRYWSRPAFESREVAAKLIQEIDNHVAARTLFQWGIVERNGSRVIGTVTLSRLDFDNRRAEVGYALLREVWGRGFATAAVSAAISFGIKELELTRFEADIDPRNVASIRMMSRLGFNYEGFLPERYRVGGEVQDTVLYGLLARHWRGA